MTFFFYVLKITAINNYSDGIPFLQLTVHLHGLPENIFYINVINFHPHIYIEYEPDNPEDLPIPKLTELLKELDSKVISIEKVKKKPFYCALASQVNLLKICYTNPIKQKLVFNALSENGFKCYYGHVNYESQFNHITGIGEFNLIEIDVKKGTKNQPGPEEYVKNQERQSFYNDDLLDILDMVPDILNKKDIEEFKKEKLEQTELEKTTHVLTPSKNSQTKKSVIKQRDLRKCDEKNQQKADIRLKLLPENYEKLSVSKDYDKTLKTLLRFSNTDLKFKTFGEFKNELRKCETKPDGRQELILTFDYNDVIQDIEEEFLNPSEESNSKLPKNQFNQTVGMSQQNNFTDNVTIDLQEKLDFSGVTYYNNFKDFLNDKPL